jgi:hypothetical protein
MPGRVGGLYANAAVLQQVKKQIIGQSTLIHWTQVDLAGQCQVHEVEGAQPASIALVELQLAGERQNEKIVARHSISFRRGQSGFALGGQSI